MPNRHRIVRQLNRDFPQPNVREQIECDRSAQSLSLKYEHLGERRGLSAGHSSEAFEKTPGRERSRAQTMIGSNLPTRDNIVRLAI